MRTPMLAGAMLLSNLGLLVALADERKQDDLSSGCTMANVAGTYGYVGFGTVRLGNPLRLPAGAYSSAGTLTFDGKGNLLISDTGRIDDFFLTPNLVYPSTYTVDQQCVGTFTVAAFSALGIPGPHYKIVFVDDRSRALAISLLPGVSVNYVNTSKIANKKEGD